MLLLRLEICKPAIRCWQLTSRWKVILYNWSSKTKKIFFKFKTLKILKTRFWLSFPVILKGRYKLKSVTSNRIQVSSHNRAELFILATPPPEISFCNNSFWSNFCSLDKKSLLVNKMVFKIWNWDYFIRI